LFESYVTQFDPCLPEFLNFLEGFDIVIIDPGVLQGLRSTCRNRLVADLQRRSRPAESTCCSHLRRYCAGRASLPLSRLEAGRNQAAQARHAREERPGLILSKPCPGDTASCRLRLTDTAKNH
jgi:hypothetical protein